jgi:hypothetical protein
MYEERCLILPELQQTYVTRWMSWDLVWNRYVSEIRSKLTLQFRETRIYECQVLVTYLKKLWPTKSGKGTKTKGVTSGFRREVVENCDILGYYAASSGNFLRTFRDNNFGFLRLKMGSISCPEASVITTTRCVITQKSAVLRGKGTHVRSLCTYRRLLVVKVLLGSSRCLRRPNSYL